MKNTLQLIYFWSKKIHHSVMWFAIVLSAFMGGTGIILESSLEDKRAWLTSMFDLILIRQLHGSTGKWLLLSLFTMILTGLVMWGYPLWVQRKKSQLN